MARVAPGGFWLAWGIGGARALRPASDAAPLPRAASQLGSSSAPPVALTRALSGNSPKSTSTQPICLLFQALQLPPLCSPRRAAVLAAAWFFSGRTPCRPQHRRCRRARRTSKRRRPSGTARASTTLTRSCSSSKGRRRRRRHGRLSHPHRNLHGWFTGSCDLSSGSSPARCTRWR
ncbi:hypothetical protein BDA96_03G248200 [Sorghum bicolor]|uniref:Secreted protein n=1 Tax=Sorghum bicolor TaxID=4558 RepID=A0A921UNE9_SORBI|nr:hypothetical protein BDA96_03G248200 [Sorghum bicolor]